MAAVWRQMQELGAIVYDLLIDLFKRGCLREFAAFPQLFKNVFYFIRIDIRWAKF